MSTLHVRNRRMLSMSRRTGLQVDEHAARGIAGRHAQGWRELNGLDDGLEAARGIVWASALGALMWAVMLAALLFVTGCGGADQPQQAAQCWCSRPTFNAVTGTYERRGQTAYQCNCGSEEHLRYGV